VYPRPNPLRARNRYQVLDLSSRMEGASPHRLVAILYDSQMARAKSILAALEAGLDFDRGGELATTLCGVYRAMQRQLAIAGQDVEKLAEVRAGVANIAQSWRALVA